jgi:poly(beta-D-mannuronate) lyase
MTIKQAITHRPDVKKHVVAGQIHDGDDDVLMIRLEDKNLFVESRGEGVLTLDPAYIEGATFTVVITALKDGIYVRYNDGPDKKALTGTFNGCYFKAGCYTQSNLSKGDKDTSYGEVVIYELKVDHV